ncbi:BamA/TamA family outer membrane protein [Mucilaginibacter ginsenosidivorans]|uniref:BamA/TamA family outer membrane protein n=1 Tax=Mucilaginibacter ginsenosidivorans TaxID=398053 RepID=A0A5B8UWT0_9SPHI|nr:BamA/TamA family outer membrane protein [Mucilaginibacter ginsenosidivorans]QEC63358.1 BamA/TamA family outer membrane protein [Mucilaginibacter ginsenosidivorans]
MNTAKGVTRMLLVVFACLLSLPVFAGARADTSKQKLPNTHRDSTKQLDLVDVMHGLFRSGVLPISHRSQVGTKPVMSLIPLLSYSTQSRMSASLKGNIAFRAGAASRISLVDFGTSYNQNGQFTLPIKWNIWNRDNAYNFAGELKFYSYPQSTFGLGSSSTTHDRDQLNYNCLRFSGTAFRRVAGNFYAGAGYVMDNHWSIHQKADGDADVSDFSAYGAAKHTVSSGFTFNALFDSRDNSVNPSHGFYAMSQFRQNMTLLGSTAAWNSVTLDVRKYFRFPASSTNVLAFWSYNVLTLSGRPPYLDMPSTFWDSNNTGRGYMQGRFRGAQMVYGEAEYRYAITANGLIGGVVFLNGQSFSAAPGTHFQAIQPGYGPGLRIKLNKVSKTNIAIDYGFGHEGSRGLFVKIGELF